MNSRRLLYTGWCAALNLLLAGCFGGKSAVVRSESQQHADTALIRGVRAEQKSNYTESDNLLTEALMVSTSIEDVPVRTTALINLARLHRLQHDLGRAAQYIDQALALAPAGSPLFAEAAHEKALLELAQGAPSKALEWAEQSIAAEQGDMRGARRNLASRIQLALGNWSGADALARAALSENRSAGHVEEEANSLRIMGIVARNEKKYSEGLQNLQEALTLDKRIGRSGKIATDLEELATTFHHAGKLAEAALYQGRAYDVNVAAGRLRQAMHNQEELAGIYTTQGETTKAAAARETARILSAQDEALLSQGSSVTINPSNKP